MTLAYYGKSRQRQALLAIVTFFAIAIGVVAAGGIGGVFPAARILAVGDDANVTVAVGINPAHLGASNPGFSPGSCPNPPAGKEGYWGWHFVAPGNATFLSLTVKFVTAGTMTDNTPPVFQADPDGSHAYVWTPTADTLSSNAADFSATLTAWSGANPPDMFNLSHVCAGSTVPAPDITKAAASTPLSGGKAVWEISVKNNSQTAMNVVVNDTDAKFGAVISGGTCPTESTGNSSPFDCSVNGSSTLKFTVTKPATNETCSLKVVKNKASVTWWNGQSSQTSGDTSEVEIEVPIDDETECDPVVLTRSITVCKVIDDNGDLTADDRTFNFSVSGGNPTPGAQFSLFAEENSQTTGTAPDCYTFSVDLDALVTITETGSDPAGWVNASFYPKHKVGGDSIVPSDASAVVDAGATCFDNELGTLRRAVEDVETISPCVVYFYNKQAPPTPRKQFLVCKVVDGNGVLPGNEGGTFTVNLSGANVSPTSMTLEQTEGGALAVGSSCEVATADDVEDAVVTITEVVPGGWSSSAGYPKHDVNSGLLVSSDASLEYDVQDCSDVNQQGGLTRAAEDQALDPLPDLCRVTFYNRTDGRVAAAPKLTIKKVITIDGSTSTSAGDTAGVNWRFNVQCGTAPAQNNVGPTDATGSFFFGSPNNGETCTISEVTQAGFGLVGWTRSDTSNNSAGPNTGPTNSVTIKMDDDDDNVVTFYNQPLGSITVTKTTVNSHNGGNDVTVASDRDGWKMTISSAACGIGPVAGHTDTNGVVTFTNLPLCNDYVVTEDVGISGTAGYVVVGSASQSGKTPGNPATQVAFKNRKTSFDPPCTVCTLVIPTPIPPTATPVPPTATPVPNTPAPFSTALGEKTPGAIATPIAPSTGTGAAGAASTFNALFALAGLVVLGSGLAVVTAGRKQR